MGRPAAAVPLPVRQHDLQRRPDRGRGDDPVEERQRLGGRQRRRGGGEHRVARLRRGCRTAVAGLGEDQRPGRVAGRLAQVDAAGAGRPAGQHQRADRSDRLVRPRQQVGHPLPGQPGQQDRVGPPGDHRQVGPPPDVVGGARLRRHPPHRPRHRGRPPGTDVGRPQAGRGDVGGARRRRVDAAHPGHPGRGEERGDARAHPAGPVDAGERRPAARQHRRPAVAVPIGERGAGQLGRQPGPQVVGQRRPQAGREVVEHPGRREQPDHPVHDFRPDSVGLGRPHYLGRVPRSVQQAHHRRRLAQPRQCPGPSRVDADLDGVPFPPQRPQPGLQRWSHETSLTADSDIPDIKAYSRTAGPERAKEHQGPCERCR